MDYLAILLCSLTQSVCIERRFNCSFARLSPINKTENKSIIKNANPVIRAIPVLGYVSNSQGSNLGCLVTPARTSGLSSIQGDLGESGKGIFTGQSYKHIICSFTIHSMHITSYRTLYTIILAHILVYMKTGSSVFLLINMI